MATRTKKEKLTKKRERKPNKIVMGLICNIIKTLFFIFRAYLDMLIDLVFSYFWDATKRRIPDLEKKHAMLSESAVKLAERIRNNELKSEDLVKACIERIKTVNPILNAMTDERFEEALKEARKIDDAIANGISEDYFNQRPFLGVPFTTKDSNAVGGLAHTLGTAARKSARASEDAECVRLLRAAGALPLAVTNVPEINKWQETRNMVYGQTNNPFHTGRTVGGSSGGEAALAAAYASPITLCSDIGGSTRMPAFYCGLFALNPTAGFTNLKGTALRTGEEISMASVGFISKHAEDLAPLTKIVAGELAPALNLERNIEIQDLKFFFVSSCRDWRVSPISQDLRKAMNRVVTKLTEAARNSDGVPKPYYHKAMDHMYSLWRYWMTKEVENFAKMVTDNKGEANALVELTKKLVGKSQLTLAAIFKLIDDQLLPRVKSRWAETLTIQFQEDLITLLGENGVLLFPSAPMVAPYHYSAFLRPYNFAYWGIFNVLRFPAAQVPLGLNSEGLPLGIQVVAAPKQDALCLAVAKYLEKEFGGFAGPCRIQKE